MRMVDIIHKKREGESLTKEEIDYMIQQYTEGNIPDYQMAAFAMAVFYKGMTDQEVADFTMAMVYSGETVDLSPIQGIKVDKHSTGGVGDKVSLIVGPLVATVGVPVVKMSGRGLGHTGGTIDKLESIDGFEVELTGDEFIEKVNRNKIAIVSQSGNLTPADKKLYSLRDVTATVDSIPMIASSIMSKKIASGADAIVLDVKTGSGAFMKSLDESKKLARTMVDIGKRLNRTTVAVITDMNQPLGNEVGNANEVKEAIETLKGNGPSDLTEVSLTIASHMAYLGGVYANVDDAYHEMEKLLYSGNALETFKTFVASQKGNPDVVTNPHCLPQAKYHVSIKAEKEGYVQQIDTEAVGISAMLLGAGRKTKEEKIDHSVGITIHKKIGDKVRKGDDLVTIHSNHHKPIESINIVKKAYCFSQKPVEKKPMIYDVIT